VRGQISVLLVFGTRPEAIKMAPLVLALQREKDLRPVVVVTGQHREMLDQVLDIFAIQPDYDLNIMRQGQTLTQVTNRVLAGLEEIMVEENPDLVLVHGDTTTSMAAALAGYYAKRPIGHVEAGLRTNDKFNPYPEEMNRRITGCLADLHFAPTIMAKENLLAENIPSAGIFVTGNTVVDALHHVVSQDQRFSDSSLEQLIDPSCRTILLTAHRRESWGQGLEQIFEAVKSIIKEFTDIQVIFPVHRNPQVMEQAMRAFRDVERVCLIEPPAYSDFARLLQRAYLVMTDSGGIQEEAPGLNVPVVVLRNTTERPEGVVSGNLVLAGTERENIYREVSAILQDEERHHKMASAPNPYGDGKASERIKDAIYYYFNKTPHRPEDYRI
jgi:UDP-N-acetylglucosamine 2-epimerase (non-hydrolysing)